jgi:hypothetical protein
MSRGTLLRAAVMLVIVLAVALVGGTWATQAQSGTIPGVGICGPYDIVAPLFEPAALLGIAGPDGQLPCGLMYICAHGHKAVVLDPDYTSCVPYGTNLTVYCWNDVDGTWQWTAQDVSNVAVWPDGSTGEFDVYQHGYCAWFPTSGTAVQGGVIQ